MYMHDLQFDKKLPTQFVIINKTLDKLIHKTNLIIELRHKAKKWVP